MGRCLDLLQPDMPCFAGTYRSSALSQTEIEEEWIAGVGAEWGMWEGTEKGGGRESRGNQLINELVLN